MHAILYRPEPVTVQRAGLRASEDTHSGFIARPQQASGILTTLLSPSPLPAALMITQLPPSAPACLHALRDPPSTNPPPHLP